MRAVLHEHPISWAPPPPLWSDAATVAMQQPAILRFATDDFMDDLQRLLATDPMKLRGMLAVPETWRGIQTSARTPTPDVGRIGLFGRLGVAARRAMTPVTARAQPLPSAPSSLKLYQPAHQRFYLVGAALVCQRAGLPDRRIDKGKEERASFVIRRYFPPTPALLDDNLPEFDEDTWTECAFVAQGEGGFAWQEVAPAGSEGETRRVVLAEEERLPLFPMNFAQDNQRTRRLLAGLIPVGKREAYQAAARKTADGASAGGASTGITARLVLFRKLVSEPWKALVDRAVTYLTAGAEEVDGETATPPAEERRRNRSDIQTASWLILTDFRQFLETYVPTVWARIAATTTSPIGPAPGSLTGDPRTLYDALLNTRINRFATAIPASKLDPDLFADGTSAPRNTAAAVATCLADALKKLTPEVVAEMEQSEIAFDRTMASVAWPSFLFPLVDTEDQLLDPAATAVSFGNSPIPQISPALDYTDPEEDSIDAEGPPLDTTPETPAEKFAVAAASFKAGIDMFAALVVRSIEAVPDAPEPAVPTAAERPADVRPGWFVIRCVYERPACGDLHDDVVSAPTERFQLAGFFDPDAPARPIRIGLPIDTTPAGLRKFDKNTAFVMSDVLCGQIARLRGLTFGDLIRSVLPWPLHKDLSVPEGGPCTNSISGNIGLVCSLSIPIITICALILLMIMVSLLDIVFRWMPFFIVCFPLPGLRAKPK